jgi:hypothetical protein
MTTLSFETVICGACGRAFRHRGIGSTNTFGSCDLDTRPPEMARSTLFAHVQRCPSCGYCAVEARQFDERYGCVLESEAYRKQLNAADCPELASSFVCAGMLLEAVGHHQEAGWKFLKAAWVLDDNHADELALQRRGQAADRFIAALAHGASLMDQAGASEAIVVDCLRRSGRSPKALELISYAERGECEPIIRELLSFQRSLLQRGDTACHTMEEVLQHRSARGQGCRSVQARP